MISFLWQTTAEDHELEIQQVLSKLEKAVYRASKKKTKLFKKNWHGLATTLIQNGVKPIKGKIEAIAKVEAPKNVKELK